jgi:hypothetical protein
MSDLITRLLEAKEQKARAAEQIHIVWNWQRMSGKQTMGAFLSDNDPSSVLRHCKADRATVIQYDLLRWRPDYTPGLGETLGVLRLIVERIAVAYGITEEEK